MATNDNNNLAIKKTKGKQKIEIKKIEKNPELLITFSKRRSGIYKKASELVTLTDSEVAFLVFSPAGNPYSFGHPSFDYLARRFLGEQGPQPLYDHEMFRHARVLELTLILNEVLGSMEDIKRDEKAMREELDGSGRPQNNWWNKDVEQVQVSELAGLRAAYLQVLAMVEKRGMEVASLGVPPPTDAFGPNPKPF